MKTNFNSFCTSISWEKVEPASYFASKHYWELFLKHPCFSSFLEKYFKLKYLLLRMTCRNWFVEISNPNQITQKQCTRDMRHIFQTSFTGINKCIQFKFAQLSARNTSQYLKWFITASKIPSIFALKKLYTSINFHGSIALHNTKWCMDQHFVGQWTFRAWFSLFPGRKALIAHDTLYCNKSLFVVNHFFN